MKKLLLAIILITNLFISDYDASESKQNMLRQSPEPEQQDVVNIETTEISNERSSLAISFIIVIAIVVIGLLIVFASKFALSLRGKPEPIYESDQPEDEN